MDKNRDEYLEDYIVHIIGLLNTGCRSFVVKHAAGTLQESDIKKMKKLLRQANTRWKDAEVKLMGSILMNPPK